MHSTNMVAVCFAPARNFQPSFFQVCFSFIPISIHPSSGPLGSGQGERQQRRLGQEDNETAADRRSGREGTEDEDLEAGWV